MVDIKSLNNKELIQKYTLLAVESKESYAEYLEIDHRYVEYMEEIYRRLTEWQYLKERI